MVIKNAFNWPFTDNHLNNHNRNERSRNVNRRLTRIAFQLHFYKDFGFFLTSTYAKCIIFNAHLDFFDTIESNFKKTEYNLIN